MCWFSILLAYRTHLNALTDIYAVKTHLGTHTFKPMVIYTSQACTKTGWNGEGQVNDLGKSGVVPGTISLNLGLRWKQE